MKTMTRSLSAALWRTGSYLLSADAGTRLYCPDINIEELDGQAAGLNIVTETPNRELTTVICPQQPAGGTNATLVMRKLKD